MYRAFSFGQEDNRLKIIVFLGTVRENRAGIRVANFVVNQLLNSKHKVDLFGEFSAFIPFLSFHI